VSRTFGVEDMGAEQVPSTFLVVTFEFPSIEIEFLSEAIEFLCLGNEFPT
jgi:hypothetical protein